MNIYVVWFPRIEAFAGKRGIVEESAERAVMFWQFAVAKEWADVLGGEVHSYDAAVTGQSSVEVEEPF
jgi:hypothetical protein